MCCFVLGFAMGRLDCLTYVGGLGSAFLLCSVCLGCCDGDWSFDWLGWILGVALLSRVLRWIWFCCFVCLFAVLICVCFRILVDGGVSCI